MHPTLPMTRARAPRTFAIVLVAIGVCAALAPGRAVASDSAPSAAVSASAAPSSAPSSSPAEPLPELPRLEPITHAEPDPAALKDLSRTLELLTADDEHTRSNAASSLADTPPSMVEAIHRRLLDVRASIDRDAAGHLLEAARKKGRKAMKKAGEGKPSGKKHKGKKDEDKDDDDDGDWLDFVLADAHPRDESWQQLVRVLAMERMLTAIGTTPAVRELVQMYAYFGDLVRIDLQRQVAKLHDKAVPALIEARQHDAKIVQRWANKELDVLGRAIPGEAVGATDTQVLADVLRAYGRTRDVDAARVILSFCNSDRVQLREAAREAVAAIGEPGVWQLRDAYLAQTGSKPPRAWGWDRIARELFALYDRARLAEVYKLMDDGLAAARAKKWEEATAAFDKVLARSPLFERRKEMVPAYVARAQAIEDKAPDAALAMLRKALRLDPKAEGAKKLEGDIDALEGSILADRGTPDKFILQRALELDPSNDRARRTLASLEDKAVARKSNMKRYVAAGGIGLVAVVLLALLAWRRRPEAEAAPTEGAS